MPAIFSSSNRAGGGILLERSHHSRSHVVTMGFRRDLITSPPPSPTQHSHLFRIFFQLKCTPEHAFIIRISAFTLCKMRKGMGRG